MIKLSGDRVLTSLTLILAVVAMAVSGMELKRRETWTANRLNEIEEQWHSTIFDKYLTAEERLALEKTIDQLASKITLLMPSRVQKIGQKLIHGIMTEMGMRYRLDKTLTNNGRYIQKAILEFIPVETNVLFNRLLDNQEDVEIVRRSIMRVVESLPEVINRYQQSVNTIESRQITEIVDKYFATFVEMMPEAKWLLSILERMTDEDYAALGQLVHNLDSWETVLERTSPFLQRQMQEVRQTLNGMAVDEARQHILTVHHRVLQAILVVRDEADLFQVLDQMLNMVMATARDYRSLSDEAMDSVEKAFPLQSRLTRALDKTVEKVAQMISYICQKTDKTSGDDRYFGKRC